MDTVLQPLSLTTDQFTLSILQNASNVQITMHVLIPTVNTSTIPQTYAILKKMLPEIFTSQCFNDSNFSFRKEVRNTELGHLFEHILLEFLCQEKTNLGFYDVEFNGETSWNWEKEVTGIFHITIDATPQDTQILKKSLEKTVSLMQLILAQQRPESYN